MYILLVVKDMTYYQLSALEKLFFLLSSDLVIFSGKSHGRSYSLFRLGQKASPGVKSFAESGRADLLEAPGPGVMDEFVAPAIPSGSGRTEATFFVDGNHSMVCMLFDCLSQSG